MTAKLTTKGMNVITKLAVSTHSLYSNFFEFSDSALKALAERFCFCIRIELLLERCQELHLVAVDAIASKKRFIEDYVVYYMTLSFYCEGDRAICPLAKDNF